MRILKLQARNFRQLKNFKIDFPKKFPDLHVVIGQNGAGKSNLMNAINWCLYGDEPHLSLESQGLPLLNTNTIESSGGVGRQTVEVEIWVTDEDNNVTFNRTSEFELKAAGTDPLEIASKFKVKKYDNQNNMVIIEDDEAEQFVNGFVPKKIRPFFFFDGERLNKYFLDATGEKIKQAVHEISQIDLISILEGKLTTLSKEISREAGKTNPELDKINTELQETEDRLKTVTEEIAEYDKQIEISTGLKKEAEDYLQGEPEIEEMEHKLRQLEYEQKEKRDSLKSKEVERKNLLMEYGKLLYVYPVIEFGIRLIEEKIDQGELPPKVDMDVLKKSINQGACQICGTNLDEEATNAISQLLKRLTLSSKVSHELSSLHGPLKMIRDRSLQYEDKIQMVNRDIGALDKELENIQAEIDNIGGRLSTFSDSNKDKIKKMHKQREDHKKLIDENKIKRGIAVNRKKELIDDLKDIENRLEGALKKDQKQKKLVRQHEFCLEAVKVLNAVKMDIMGDIKNKIEAETNETFHELVWKKKTFKNTAIDSEYNIHVTHQHGYECLGSLSAAERQLLALSFTLALHKISGFDSPLIIDTPVSRVSDKNRSNFAKVLLDVSKGKQIVLLFTPDEFTGNVESVFRPEVNSIRHLKPSSDETFTDLEAV